MRKNHARVRLEQTLLSIAEDESLPVAQRLEAADKAIAVRKLRRHLMPTKARKPRLVLEIPNLQDILGS